MESTSDIELLKRLARGDGEALKVLFQRYFALLVAVGARILGDSDEGKDVAQKVFITLWEKRTDLVIGEDTGAYLKRMAINEALGRKRTDSRRQVIRDGLRVDESVAPTGEQEVIADETRTHIRYAVERLPEKTREVFVLSRYEELSYKEISDTLDISVKTVEYHMGRALLELRKEIRD